MLRPEAVSDEVRPRHATRGAGYTRRPGRIRDSATFCVICLILTDRRRRSESTHMVDLTRGFSVDSAPSEAEHLALSPSPVDYILLNACSYNPSGLRLMEDPA